MDRIAAIMERLKLEPVKRTVCQDGRDFYIYVNGKFIEAISAPFVVHEYDMKKALLAREWFTEKMRRDKVPFDWMIEF